VYELPEGLVCRPALRQTGLIISFVLALILARTDAAADAPIKIGVITDLSGKMAYWGQQTRLGAELARETLRGEGRQVEFFFEDTALDTAKSVSAAQKLIHLDQVDALYSEFSAVSTAVSPVALKNRRMLVHDAGTAEIIKSNPYSFKSFIDFEEGCRLMVKLFQARGISKIGMLKMSIDSAENCLSTAKEAAPDMVVLDYNTGEDQRTLVLTARSRGAGALLNITYEPDLLNTLKAVKTIGYEVLIGTNENAITSNVTQGYPELLERLFVLGFGAVSPEFLARLKEKDPKSTGANIEAAALAYTHLRQISAALSACAGRELECQMNRMAESPPDDTIGFRGWKNRAAQFGMMIRGWKDGVRYEVAK